MATSKKMTNQQLGLFLGSLSDFLSGRDPMAGTLQRQQYLQQQELKTEQEKRKQRLSELAKTNPEFAKMYELFGESGLQQQYMKTTGDVRQEETLARAGFTPQEISLVLAGVTPKDVMEFRQDGALSGEQIIKNVEQNVETTVEQTGVLDTFANLDQAFGPVDAAQEALSKASRVLGFEVDPLLSGTGAAVRARNSLNTEILANLAADFTGRPNLLIYENLKGNLPMSSATSEKDAKEKYINVKDQVDARVNNLKQGLKSTTVSDSDKEKYRDELNKSILLSKKLDSAILSLGGKADDLLEPQNNATKPKKNDVRRDYSSLFTED